VREESARRTRRAVVAAAARLFAERGYESTSLADVAAAAGVARPTVFASFGSKAALLQEVIDQALAGDDEPVPVADRPWFRPVWEARTQPGVLDAYAGVCTLIGSRAGGLFEVVRRAADSSEDAQALWDRLQSNRRAGAAMVVERLERLGRLAPGLGTETAVDSLWVFNDPALFELLVLQRRWGADEFTAWLAARMRDALIAKRTPARRPRLAH
jgi:AcrR family transcriptional regulator